MTAASAVLTAFICYCCDTRQVRIKCRDYVRKIAVYRDRLAVQLPDKVHVYEVCTKRLCTLRTLCKFYCSRREASIQS
jgi:hypothetical protein